MKQTATQWLFDKLWETPKDKLTWNAILEQAKAMEKEQIRDAYWNGYENYDNEETAEQYYVETYGK
jgi:hypothetical protein